MKKAQSEMDTISTRLAQQYPTDDAGWGAVVLRLNQQMFQQVDQLYGCYLAQLDLSC